MKINLRNLYILLFLFGLSPFQAKTQTSYKKIKFSAEEPKCEDEGTISLFKNSAKIYYKDDCKCNFSSFVFGAMVEVSCDNIDPNQAVLYKIDVGDKDMWHDVINFMNNDQNPEASKIAVYLQEALEFAQTKGEEQEYFDSISKATDILIEISQDPDFNNRFRNQFYSEKN